MEHFISPSFFLPLAWTVDLTYPFLLDFYLNIDGIEITAEDERMLRTLRQERLLLLCNHPTTAEPCIAFHIGNVMGGRFRYMAARGLFDEAMGLMGKLIRNLGAFSVIAGAADRESFKTARNSLSEKYGKLALFPEGEPTSGENDNLMPFQPGCARLAFLALDDACKQETNSEIKLLPTFIKYIYLGTDAYIKSDLHVSVKKIEARYKIDPGNRNLLRRFLTIGRVLLEEAEEQYRIVPPFQADYDYRMGRVRHVILDNVAQTLELEDYDKRASAIDKLRRLLGVLEMIEVGLKNPGVRDVSETELKLCRRECQKAYDFIAVKPEYLVSRPTAERFYEWLTRFETYIFGSSAPRTRKAVVSFASPFNLSDYYDDYRRNKKETTEVLLGHLRRDMQQLLDRARELSKPIVRPFDVGDEDV